MSPDQASAKGTEHGHQTALFIWAAMVQHRGWSAANDMLMYQANPPINNHQFHAISALRWLHAIPNGGARDPITAARMKAEGVKRGVPDLFLPVARHGWHGLYLEMKKDKGKPSDEQKEFAVHCETEQYAFHFCYNWREAANFIEQYLR